MMKKLICLFWMFGILAAGVGNAAELKNELKNHPSPYLAMHGDDPVHWRRWGADVLTQARKENKLLFVSSGYFSCYWCHVMQAESYRDAETARRINASYIPVKIDRELQPALDARLIDFAQRTRGHAGWPLNVFLTPEGYPLFAITYMPRDSFRDLLDKLQARWEKEGKALTELARKAAKETSQKRELPARFDSNALDKQLVSQVHDYGDELEGGFGQQNKFPMAPQLLALLDRIERKPSKPLREFLGLTLSRMADRGLRDHIGGGFFRYTVDPNWQVPHFEKMLYDNALLVRVYLRAGHVLGERRFHTVARETLEFVLRELDAGDGTYVSSLSAVDDKDVEGGYYLWQRDEIKKQLTAQEWRVAERFYGLDAEPNLEHGYHLMPMASVSVLATQIGKPVGEIESSLTNIRNKLLAARGKRRLPVDIKVLAGWNGLMLEALVEAATTFEKDDPGVYTRAARRLRDQLVNKFWSGSELSRARTDTGSLGSASLQDYAYVAAGLWTWRQAFGDDKDEALIGKLVDASWRRFHIEGGWQLGDELLIPAAAAEPAIADGPMPSPAATMIRVTQAVHGKAGEAVSDAQLRQALGEAYTAVQLAPLWHASYVHLYQSTIHTSAH